MRILIGDDDIPGVAFVSFLLKEAGYQVLVAHDGPGILQGIQRGRPDLVLLEVLLPKLSGFDVCQQIRGFSDVPIVFLSACHQVRDRVHGLQIGGDDFLTKPFEPVELLARIEAVLRRCKSINPPPAQVRLGGMTVDPVTHTVWLGDNHSVPLTPIEFRMLYYLMTNAGRILNLDQIRSNVWGDDGDESSLTATYIRRLRTKIEPDATRPRHIITVRNLGYKFEA